MTTANSRVADHEIEPIFLDRWSPRAFTGEQIPEGDLLRIFEAARWAPSSYNSQPWRFLYARRDTPDWARFLGFLNEYNRGWAQQAGALVVLVSKETMLPPGKDKEIPSYSHSFDAGSAWAHMALQGARIGWYAHAMVGADFDAAFAELSVPQGYRVECIIAIGRRADPETLPDAQRAREQPNGRAVLAELVHAGSFRAG